MPSKNSPPPYSSTVPDWAAYSRTGKRPPVRIQQATRDRKLVPVVLGEYSGNRHRPIAVGPHMVSTYVAIAATCPESCQFRDGACYVLSGFTARTNRLLEEGAEGMAGDEVIDQEIAFLGGLFSRREHRVPQDGGRDGQSGRDLRLHVGGDTPSAEAARKLGLMAARWKERGGGEVFTYTHRWREFNRNRWGYDLSVLASVETFEEAKEAGDVAFYASAIVVAEHPENGRAWVHEETGLTVVPCPAETRSLTCVQCRLCMRDEWLWITRRVIAFALHGRQKHKHRLRVVEQSQAAIS